MDDDTIWRHIDEQRAALCDLLETLDPEQWDRPSLCAGWTVRDVAAHLTFAQAHLTEVLGPMLRSGLRMNAMIRRTALESPLEHEEIIAALRGFIGSRRHVAMVSQKEPLVDVLVHSQDIAVPLGIDHPMPGDAAEVALERVLQLNRRPGMRLRPLLRGIRLVATDRGWEAGQGRAVRGPIRWLLMYAAGRDAALAHLERAAA